MARRVAYMYCNMLCFVQLADDFGATGDKPSTDTNPAEDADRFTPSTANWFWTARNCGMLLQALDVPTMAPTASFVAEDTRRHRVDEPSLGNRRAHVSFHQG